MYSEEWLYGSIRKYAPEIRAVWTDLQAMASKPPFCGKICISENIGYSFEQLAGLFNTPVDVFINAIDIFVFEKYISISDNKIITLLDWEKYQSEYDRLRKYKEGTSKSTKKDTLKNTKKDTSKCTALIRRRTEGEREGEEENRKECLSPVPVDPRYKLFIQNFDDVWKNAREGKPGYGIRDFGALKAMLKKHPEATGDSFALACNNCLDDSFHAKNFSLCYVASQYAKLLNLSKTVAITQKPKFEFNKL